MARRDNRFGKYQEANQRKREILIEQYLITLKASRVRFPHVTGLAVMVAAYLAEQQGEPCHKATLLRNVRYKTLLLNFMATKNRGVGSLPLTSTNDEAQKVLLISAQLEASNLKQNAARMKAYIAHLEKGQKSLPPPGSEQENDADTAQMQQALHKLRMMHTQTCQALYSLLRHFSTTIAVETDKEQILDRSRLRHNVIVGAPLATPFFEWLRANGDIQGMAG